jgi:hypothetical protein
MKEIVISYVTRQCLDRRRTTPRINIFKITFLVDEPSKEEDGGTWSGLRRRHLGLTNNSVHCALEDEPLTTVSTEGKLERTRRVFKRDVPNRVTTLRTLRHRSDTTPDLGFRPEILTNPERASGVSTHLNDSSKKGNDTHRRRRCWHQPKTGKLSSVTPHSAHPTHRPICSHHRLRNTSPS